MEKSAERLPIAAKTKAALSRQINENNAVIERYQDELIQTVDSQLERGGLHSADMSP